MDIWVHIWMWRFLPFLMYPYPMHCLFKLGIVHKHNLSTQQPPSLIYPLFSLTEDEAASSFLGSSSLLSWSLVPGALLHSRSIIHWFTVVDFCGCSVLLIPLTVLILYFRPTTFSHSPKILDFRSMFDYHLNFSSDSFSLIVLFSFIVFEFSLIVEWVS